MGNKNAAGPHASFKRGVAAAKRARTSRGRMKAYNKFNKKGFERFSKRFDAAMKRAERMK